MVASRDDGGDAPLAPPITTAEGERVAPAPRADSDAIRPAAPVRAEPRSARTWPWVALAAVIGLVGAIAVAAFIMRQKPQDLAVNPSAATGGESAASQSASKISQRVQAAPQPPPPTPSAPAPSDGSAPAPAEGAAAPATDASAPSAAPSNPAAPAPSAAPAAGGQPDAQSPAPAAANSSLAVAARAAMLVASPDDPQKPSINLGSVVWSAIPPTANQPATIGVVAEADVPDLKLHVVMTLRKNFDATLQATHTIDLKFTLADGSPIKGVKDIGLPQMRKEGSNADETLTGGRVKINDLYFLVGLWGGDADLARNIDLMSTRAWFDFPLLLLDGRIAKLVLQKSPQGEEILNQAFAAWK